MQATGPLRDALERLEGYRKILGADIPERDTNGQGRMTAGVF
jgi:hypothetical protein